MNPSSKCPLRILQWNICSVRSKKDNLIYLINQHNPDIVFLNETWLKPEEGFHVKGFVCIREDRVDGYGGVATLIKENIPFQRIMIHAPFLPNHFQFIAIIIQNISLINIYNPPTINIYPKVWEKFIKSFFSPIVIMGDLNAHHSDWDTCPINRNGRSIQSTLGNLDLVVLNDGTPTRFTPPTSQNLSAVDLSLCSSAIALDMTWLVLADPGTSDHFPILCTAFLPAQISQQMKHIPKRAYKRANWQFYQDMISGADLNHSTPSYEHLSSLINSAADAAIPLTNTSPKSNNIPVPWWDTECTQAMTSRREALTKFSRNCTLENYLNAKQLIAASHRLFKKKKREKYRTFCSTLNRNSNHTRIWSFFRNMSRAFSPTPPSRLPPSGIALAILGQLSICNILPDFHLQPNPPGYESFTPSELDFVLTHRKDTAPGIDQVSYSMIVNLPEKAKEYLLVLYNRCLQGYSVPSAWKSYLVCPLLKPGKDPEIVSGYRPIALSSCVGKTLELLIKNRLEWYVESNSILSRSLAAFRKGHSLTDNIVYLTSQVLLSFSKNQYTIAVFLDIKSAFDNVDIFTLYDNMLNYNIPPQLCNLIFNLMNNRLVHVKDKNGTLHGPNTATQGLPQGSALAPILFNLYISGICDVIPSPIKTLLYADDLVVLISGQNIPNLISQMNEAMSVIMEWLNTHNLTISTEKSAAMLFRKRATHNQHSNIIYNDEIIPWKSSVRYLGVTFQNNLKWTEHVKITCSKAVKGLNIMRASAGTRWGADPIILRSIYFGIVRSHLDYCCQILQPLTKQLTQQLDRIQYQGLRIILGCMKSTPTNVLQAEAAEPSLDYRRKWLSLKFTLSVFKITNHPLCTLLEDLSDYCYSRQGYWTNRAAPLVIGALKAIKHYHQHLVRFSVLPCFKIRLGYQLMLLDFQKLNLHKDEDNHLSFIHIKNSTWPSHTLLYTDASLDPNTNKTGIGIYIPDLQYEYSVRLPSCTQIYAAEVIAILKACQFVHDRKLTAVVICSDSLSALQMITKASFNNKSQYVTLKTKQLIVDLKRSGVDIQLAWIPSHTNIHGNDKADALAKAATSLSTYINFKVDPDNILPILKKNLFRQWQHEWKQTTSTKGSRYAEYQGAFPSCVWFSKFPYFDRRHICTVIRIRTGHCLTKKHKFRIGIADDPYCECGQVEDLNHIFFTCPINILPDFDLYSQLISCNIPTPIDISTVIQNLNFQASLVITSFLRRNNITL